MTAWDRDRRRVRASFGSALVAAALSVSAIVAVRAGQATDPDRFGVARHPVEPSDEKALPDTNVIEAARRHRVEVRRLESALKSAANRDSLRLLLAAAWRGTGTIEGRQRALDLLRRIRPKYFDEPRYHIELARTYLEAERRAEARDESAQAIRLDPKNLEARLLVARVLREYLLRYGQPEDAAEAVRLMAETTAIEPESAEAHLEYALCLELARMVVPGDRAAQSLAVLREAEAVLVRAPANAAARSLRAVALLDLGWTAAADRELRAWEASSGARLPGTLEPAPPSPADWIGTVATRSEERASFSWSRLDPTPLTAVNEAELEYRRRLLLADLVFAEPERSLRGWMTARGEIFVRYGPPHALTYRQAQWEEAEASIPVDLGLERKRSKQVGSLGAEFSSPVQRWAYRFDGRDLAFDFADPTLQGDFVVLDGRRHAEQKRELPMVLLDTFAGSAPTYYFAAAGTRDAGGRTRLALSLAVPVVATEADDAAGSAPGVRILEADGREVQAAALAPVPGASVEPAPGLRLRTARGELLVPAGRYSAEVRLDTRRAAGSFVVPIAARDFGGDRLSISDLELSFPPLTPNPGGLATARSRIQVKYEVYQFSIGADGKARYRTRSGVVPRMYAVAASRLLATPGSGIDAQILAGGSGQSLEGITLSARNYLDVVFPEKEEKVAPGARGRFTFDLDASSLDPGEYALTVLVEDRVARATVLAQAEIRVLDEAGIRALSGE